MDVPYPKALERFPTLRQSLLASFDACAMQARMDMDYRQGWSGHPQARGTIAHRAIARCLEVMARENASRIEPDQALAILRDTLRQHDVEPQDVLTIPSSEIKDLRWMLVSWAHNTEWDIENLVDIEQRLERVVRYDNPLGGWVERRLTGQLDALFIEGERADHAIVPDWKSGWALPPESEMSEGSYFQQRWYAILVFGNYPSVQKVTLREFYLRYASGSPGRDGKPKSPIREATIYRDDIEDIEEEFSALAERFDRAYEHGGLPWDEEALELVERGKAETDPEKRADLRKQYRNYVGLWAPAPGAHCSHCPRPQACPIFPTARGEGEITSPEQAERVAAELIVAQSVAKQRSAALRAYSSSHGPVPVRAAKDPNRVMGYVPARRIERPTRDAVERAIVEAGGDVKAEDLLGLWREKPSTRFEQYTRDPEAEAEAGRREDEELTAALQESVDRAKNA